jgi:transcriptional regulator with XRE-family HTH domain
MNLKEENEHQVKVIRENIRFLRQRRNWSIKQLSELSGISEEILIDIEEDGDFETQYLFKLCAVYHIKPHEVFFPIKK